MIFCVHKKVRIDCGSIDSAVHREGIFCNLGRVFGFIKRKFRALKSAGNACDNKNGPTNMYAYNMQFYNAKTDTPRDEILAGSLRNIWPRMLIKFPFHL